MAVRRRGNSYQVDVKVRGTRVRETALSHEKAVALEAEIRSTLLKGQVWVSNKEKQTGVQRTTTQEFIEIVNSTRWSQAKVGHQLKRNAELVADIAGTDFPIAGWSQSKIDDVVEHMLEVEKLTPAAVNRRLSAIAVVLRAAVKRNALEKMPDIPRFKESQGRFWTLDNIPGYDETFERKMLDFLVEKDALLFHDFCVVMTDTGARNGELYKLRDGDVQNGKVTFYETKTGRNRTVPLTKRALVCLMRRMGSGHPFKDIGTGVTRYWWDEIRENFALTTLVNFSSYCMRHTCASRLARKNVPAAAIQKWMGHTSLATTMRYIHMHQSDLDIARDALEQDNGLSIIRGGKP